MPNQYTINYYRTKQGRLPMFISDCLEIGDPVLAFDEIMEEIEIGQYLKPEGRYNSQGPEGQSFCSGKGARASHQEAGVTA